MEFEDSITSRKLLNKAFAECVGTFAIVFAGCGSIMVAERFPGSISVNIRALAKRLKKSLSETIQLACEKFILEAKPEEMPPQKQDFKFRF